MEKYKLVNKMVKTYIQLKDVDSISSKNLRTFVAQIFNYLIMRDIISEYSFTDAKKVEGTDVYEFSVCYKCDSSEKTYSLGFAA